MEMDETLPRDEFSRRLRELTDNPGALKASSRVDIVDFYGRNETWTLDTFRHDGAETTFIQRMSAEGALRLVLPPQVTTAVRRQVDSLTGRSRARGARQAVETKRSKGQRVGNPEALRKARRKAR
jgi:hypothetical protein